MADDPHNTSDISDQNETVSAKEDAETTAARRELKQASISEKDQAGQSLQKDDQSGSGSDDGTTTKDNDSVTGRSTPESGNEDGMRERISSPKKKRVYDELDEPKPTDNANEKPLAFGPAPSRTDRSEPEKKRPRDRNSKSSDEEVEPLSASSSTRSSLDISSSDAKATTTATEDSNKKPATTSASAFANSTFGKLASSSASPFGTFGAGKPSLFGGAAASGSGSSSPFGSFGGPAKPAASVGAASPPKLSFGASAAASPFAAANGGAAGKSLFGGGASPFSSGFGSTGGSSALSGLGGGAAGAPRLSFLNSKPGEALKSAKPAKPFGAPESDEEDGSENEEGDDEDAGSDKEEKEKEEQKSDDKKKPRLHKVNVDDGEGGEVTLLAIRAKMFQMEKGVGWKERGAGMLKVNVPRDCVELDEYGNPDPTTFNASVLDEDEEQDGSGNDDDEEKEEEGEESAAAEKKPQGRRHHVRLIMRQDHTLRVILNTVIVPAMMFQLNQKLKAAYVLFTAFEEGEAKQVQMKMSDANATTFIDLMQIIKKELADDA